MAAHAASSSEISPSTTIEDNSVNPEFSRKDMAQKAIVLAGVGLLVGDALFGRHNGNLFTPPIDKKWGMKKTAIMAALSIVSDTTITEAVPHLLKINAGNPGDGEIDALFAKKPLEASLITTVMCPAFEEGLFRLAPSAIADRIQPSGRNSGRWGLGATSSFLFAIGHTIGVDKDSSTKDRIPIYLFAAGLLSWHIQRQGGFKHALLSHVGHNTLSLADTFYQIRKDNKGAVAAN